MASDSAAQAGAQFPEAHTSTRTGRGTRGIFDLIGAVVLCVGGPSLAEWSGFPAPLRHALAAASVLAGLNWAWLVVRDLLLRRRHAEARKAGSLELWNLDYHWDPTGQNESATRDARFLSVALLVLLLAEAVILELARSDSILYFFAVFFGIFVLYLAWFICRVFISRKRFGNPRLKFEQFPYFTGQELRASFHPGKRLTGVTELRLTLRCIREFIESRTNSEGPGYVGRVLYSETQLCGVSEISESLPVQFAIPDIYPTHLTGGNAQFWQLLVQGFVNSKPYNAEFILPVYRASRPNMPGVTSASSRPIP